MVNNNKIWDALDDKLEVLGTCDYTVNFHTKRQSCPNWKPLPAIKRAKTRATTLPVDAAERKTYPVASGVLDYFPDAIAAIAHVSYRGNAQHHPNEPLHWDRSKSTDEADTMLRHFLQRGTRDMDGMRHTAKMAWRALALLQKEIEAERIGENNNDSQHEQVSACTR